MNPCLECFEGFPVKIEQYVSRGINIVLYTVRAALVSCLDPDLNTGVTFPNLKSVDIIPFFNNMFIMWYRGLVIMTSVSFKYAWWKLV